MLIKLKKNSSLFFAKKALLFDIKCMGANAFLPTALILLSLVFLLLLQIYAQFEHRHICLILELFIPISGFWYAIFLMRPILEISGGELYFSYPVSRSYLGVFRILRMISVCAVQMAVFTLCACSILAVKLNDIAPTILLSFAQTIFFGCLGFLAITIIKDSFASLIVCFAYVIFYQFTQGNLLPFFSVYLFSEKLLSPSELLEVLPKTLLFCALLTALAQRLFNRMNYLFKPDED